jgi:uncharacterized membrane protein
VLRPFALLVLVLLWIEPFASWHLAAAAAVVVGATTVQTVVPHVVESGAVAAAAAAVVVGATAVQTVLSHVVGFGHFSFHACT